MCSLFSFSWCCSKPKPTDDSTIPRSQRIEKRKCYETKYAAISQANSFNHSQGQIQLNPFSRGNRFPGCTGKCGSPDGTIIGCGCKNLPSSAKAGNSCQTKTQTKTQTQTRTQTQRAQSLIRNQGGNRKNPRSTLSTDCQRENENGCKCGKPLRPVRTGNMCQLKAVCICGQDGLQVVRKGTSQNNVWGFSAV